jgi:glycerol uptake facilitator protein
MHNEFSAPQRLFAEFLGTGLLVLVGAGAIPATFLLNKMEGAPAITMAGLGMIGLAFGVIIAALVYAFAEVSGCHINPAVTLGLAATGHFPWKAVPGYMIAQFLGGITGAFAIVTLFGSEVARLNISGAPIISKSISPWQAFATEAIGTFILVFIVFAFVVEPKARKEWAGLIIGLLVAGEIIVFGALTYCAINPARAFGPMLVQAWLGGPNLLLNNFWVYILGDFGGGLLGAFAYQYLIMPRAGAAARHAEPSRKAERQEETGQPVHA